MRVCTCICYSKCRVPHALKRCYGHQCICKCVHHDRCIEHRCINLWLYSPQCVHMCSYVHIWIISVWIGWRVSAILYKALVAGVGEYCRQGDRLSNREFVLRFLWLRETCRECVCVCVYTHSRTQTKWGARFTLRDQERTPEDPGCIQINLSAPYIYSTYVYQVYMYKHILGSGLNSWLTVLLFSS